MSSASDAGRIVCPKCGANNFNTQSACWKCGSALSSGGILSPQPSSAPPASVSPSRSPADVRLSPAANLGVPQAAARVISIDPAVAVWSAIALAVIFPYFAVPVGIVFLMLDDRRRAEIGRITLIWGIAASIVQSLIAGVMLKASVNAIMGGGMLGGGSHIGFPGAHDLRPNDTVPSQTLPPEFRQ